MIIENHMVMRDQAYREQMSTPEWIEETETCPLCNGEQYIAHRCTCGTMPDIGDDECVLCGKPIHWKTCPCCLGKGETPVRS